MNARVADRLGYTVTWVALAAAVGMWQAGHREMAAGFCVGVLAGAVIVISAAWSKVQ